MTESQQNAYVDHQGELEMVRESDGLWVELHTAIVPTYYMRGRRTDDLWDRLVPARLTRTEVLALAPRDELEALCIHGSKHRWQRLAWILDVAMIAKMLTDSDWQNLLVAAHAHGTGRIVHLGVLLAADLCGASLPPDVEREARADRGARPLARQVQRELFDPRPHATDALLFHARMRERTADQLRYLFNVAFMPSGADWDSLAVPRALFPIYTVTRPVRLGLKYARRLIDSGH